MPQTVTYIEVAFFGK